MRKDTRLKRLLAVAGLIAVVLAIYFVWARPYQLRWGATDEEVQRPMAGDELNTNPDFLATRAITVDGTPQEIWPWLIQMGYGRGGFYGYDLLENLGNPSATRILPQYQDLHVGDDVPIGPAGGMIFLAIEPYDYLIWSGGAGHGGFTWALYPVDASQTRLVNRFRWSYRWKQPAMLMLDVFTEFTDHLAVRKILHGVKGRVEARIEPSSEANIEFFIYLGSALVFVYAAISVLRLPLSWGSWLVGLAGGLAWLACWYAPMSIWIGALLSFVIVWAVRVEFRGLQQIKKQQDEHAQPKAHNKR